MAICLFIRLLFVYLLVYFCHKFVYLFVYSCMLLFVCFFNFYPGDPRIYHHDCFQKGKFDQYRFTQTQKENLFSFNLREIAKSYYFLVQLTAFEEYSLDQNPFFVKYSPLFIFLSNIFFKENFKCIH